MAVGRKRCDALVLCHVTAIISFVSAESNVNSIQAYQINEMDFGYSCWLAHSVPLLLTADCLHASTNRYVHPHCNPVQLEQT